MFEQHLPARPRLVARFLVAFTNIRVTRLARTHEAVAGALVDHRVVALSRVLHRRRGLLDAGVDARVVLAVEAEDRALDLRERGLVLGRRAVEDQRGRERLAVRREPERLSAARRAIAGIEVDETTWSDIRTSALTLGITDAEFEQASRANA